MKGLSQDLSAGPQWLYMREDSLAYATHFFGLPKYFEGVRGMSASNGTDGMEEHCVEIIRDISGRYNVVFRRGGLGGLQDPCQGQTVCRTALLREVV